MHEPAPILIVVAAPVEAAAVTRALGAEPPGRAWRVHRLTPGVGLVMTGIGKVNAAAAVSRCLERGVGGRYRAVISMGIAGALPGSGLEIGDVVAASTSVYADEGLVTPSGFMSCAEMGFPLGPFEGNAVKPDAALLERASEIAKGMGGCAGVVATVSTCSGTDEQARMIVERTGAIGEAMEGAAVGHTVARFSDEFPRRGAGFVELRVISNTTGDRTAQRWDMRRALARLGELAGRLV